MQQHSMCHRLRAKVDTVHSTKAYSTTAWVRMRSQDTHFVMQFIPIIQDSMCSKESMKGANDNLRLMPVMRSSSDMSDQMTCLSSNGA